MVLRVKKLQPVVTVGNTQRVAFNNQPLKVSTPKGVNTPQQNQAIGIIKDRLRSGQVSREQAGQQIYNIMSSNAVPTMRQLSGPRNTYNQFGGGLVEAQPLRLAGTLQRGVGNAIGKAPGLQKVGQNIAEGGRRFENLFNTRGTVLGPENSRGTIDEFARAGGAFVADAPLMGAGSFVKPFQAAKGASGLTKAGVMAANYGRGFATSGAGLTGIKHGVNEFQEQYDAARAAGVDPTRATLTGLGSAGVNAIIERAGVEKLGNPLKILDNTATRRIVSRALSEGTEEGLQTITSNLFSKTYNPETGVFDNVPKSVLFGAALGGIAGAPIELAQNPQQAKATAKKTLETVDNTVKLADAEKIYTKADQKVKRSEQDVFVSFNKMLLAQQKGDQRSYKSQKAKWKQAQRQLKKAQIARDLADKNRKGGGALSIRDVSLDNTQDLPQGDQQNELLVESASSPQSIDPLESLKQEARKYKSAEEFVGKDNTQFADLPNYKFDINQAQKDFAEIQNLTEKITTGMPKDATKAQRVKVYKDTITAVNKKYGTNISTDISDILDVTRNSNKYPNELAYEAGRKAKTDLYNEAFRQELRAQGMTVPDDYVQNKPIVTMDNLDRNRLKTDPEYQREVNDSMFAVGQPTKEALMKEYKKAFGNYDKPKATQSQPPKTAPKGKALTGKEMGELYHGTRSGNKFDRFDKTRANQGVGMNAIDQGDQIYLTPNKPAAEFFSKKANETYRIKNTDIKTLKAPEGFDGAGEVLSFRFKDNAKLIEVDSMPRGAKEAQAVLDDLKKQGYDGVVFPDRGFDGQEGYPDLEAIFKDGQPKSVIVLNESNISSAAPSTQKVVDRQSTDPLEIRRNNTESRRQPQSTVDQDIVQTANTETLSSQKVQTKTDTPQKQLSPSKSQTPKTAGIQNDGQADAIIRSFRPEEALRLVQPETRIDQSSLQGQSSLESNGEPILENQSSQPSNTKESLWLQDPEAVREEMYGKINAVTIKSRGKDSVLLLDGVTDNVAITNAARKAQQDGTEFNFYAEKDGNDRSVAIKPFDPARHAIQAGFVVDANANILGNHIKVDPTGVSVNVGGELINMSQILGDMSQWKNTYRITETMDRNLQRQAPTEEAYLKARRFLIDHKLQKEADFRQELQQQRADLVARKQAVEAVRPDGVSKDEFNSDLFDYIEGNLSQADMMNRYGAGEQIITQYKNDTRALYDQLLDRVNAEFEKYGEATISKRDDYITHINELMGNQSYVGEMFGRLKNSVTGEGEQRTRNDVPGEIAGRTETFEPRKRWNPFFQQRTGGNFTKDPFKAVDAYLEPTLYNIHMTESTVRARAIESAFRTASELQKYETQYMADDFKSTIDSMKNKQGLSKVVTGMQEYANALAGKTQRIDRQFIDAGEQGQNLMKGWQALQRVGGRATIVGNASSVISQTLGLPATIADTGPVSATKGLARYAAGDPVIEKSNFVKARITDVASPFESNFEKALQAGGKPLQYVENQYVKYTWYAQYESALARGFKGQEAIMEADRRTERVVAGRGIADRPEAYRSTLINGFAQYTLEVNAQNKLFWQDLDAKQKGMYFVGTFIANSIVGAITGFEPLPDPIEAAIKSYQDFATPDEERDAGDKVVATGQRFLGEFADMNPWVQAAATQLPDDTRKKIFGEDSSIGRFGDQSAPIKVVSDTVSGISNVGKGDYREAVNDFLRIAPAGNQVRKTAGGIELNVKGYATNSDGDVLYMAPENPLGKAQSIVFGPSATRNAQEYYGSNFSRLGGKDAEQFKALPEDQRQKFFEDRMGIKKLAKDKGISISRAEKQAANESGDYNAILEQYGLKDLSKPKNTGGVKDLIAKDDTLYAARGIVGGYQKYKDLPPEVADRWLKENGFTREDVEMDIAAEEKVATKAEFLAPQLSGKSEAEQLAALQPYLKETLSGNYFASYGTLKILADKGIISEGLYKQIRYRDSSKTASSKGGRRGGSRRGGGRRASGKAAANRALKIASSAMKTDPIKVGKTSTTSIKDPGIAKKILARKRSNTPKLKKIRINKNA
jgi:hypothetical protein